MENLILPSEFNYVAAFLTFACQLRCPYCINHHGGDLVKNRRMSGEEWIKGINRLVLPPDVPITLQGGEPTVHKDIVEIINGISSHIPIDILTNLERPLDQWLYKIPPERLKRKSPYASIRVSWHRGQHSLEDLLRKVAQAQEKGFHIGIWTVMHPDYEAEILEAQHTAKHMGIDFRLKEFLGPWKGVNHGTFRYPEAVNGPVLRECQCRTTEMLIAPDGQVYRCHSDLYAARFPIGHILDAEIPLLGQWAPCAVFGKCNSCDIKVKFNRYQQPGHSSVEIRSLSQPYAQNADVVSKVENTYGKTDQPK